MRKLLRWSSVLLLLILVTMGVGPVLAQDAEPADEESPLVDNGDESAALLPPTTVIYNLYATDGYTTLADGTPLYTYGYVGGRQGVAFSYLDSAGALQTMAGGPPAPTGGPITAAELPLLGNAQVPAPVIYARVGDVVEIRLKNLGVNNPDAPNDPHTIHLHGVDVDAANDGVPETSIAAIPANSTDPGAGNVVVYMFPARLPGTYMYHCHQEADIHVQMGMYGALVIYNRTDAAALTGPGKGAGGVLWGWRYNKDYVMLLTEVDVRQHTSEDYANGLRPVPPGTVTGFNPADYRPQYWMINGLSFPNTVHLNTATFNWANWIAANPNMDPFITGRASSPAVPGGEKVLVRMINLGFETQPMHVHGFHYKVLGSDQRAWPWANSVFRFGMGLEKNTTLIGSGETYELLFDFGQQKVTSTYPPASFGVPASTFVGGTQSRYDTAAPAQTVLPGQPAYPAGILPVSNTTVASPAIPDLFVGGTFAGGPVVTGISILADTSQYFPWHNHDDYKATNNGAYPGGMFTLLKVLP